MADDKKPKIDLKSRLQKMGNPGGTTPPPPGAGGVPMGPGSIPAPMPRTAPSMPPPMTAGGSVAPPPGIPKPAVSNRAPALDPGNPLAAVVQPFKPVAAAPVHPAIAPPQVIEVDELAVHQARSGGFKRGLVAGIVVAAMFGVLGYVGGSATAQNGARGHAVQDAHDLAGDLGKAKESLDQLKTKVQEGGKTLIGERKFPTDLAQQLAGMNVDFGGDKLFGRRFSGVPADTTRNLFDFITRVQSLNDKKDVVIGLLNKLQKPITEELARGGQLPISQVVIVDKDTGGSGASLALLVTPISPDDKNGVPNDLTFMNPRGSGNVKLPRLEGDKIPPGGAAVTIVPSTFEKMCPAATHGQIVQLVSAMNSLANDVEGVKSEGEIQEGKAGLSETAAKLQEQLVKVN